jgi:hypothetical protein
MDCNGCATDSASHKFKRLPDRVLEIAQTEVAKIFDKFVKDLEALPRGEIKDGKAAKPETFESLCAKVDIEEVDFIHNIDPVGLSVVKFEGI